MEIKYMFSSRKKWPLPTLYSFSEMTSPQNPLAVRFLNNDIDGS